MLDLIVGLVKLVLTVVVILVHLNPKTWQFYYWKLVDLVRFIKHGKKFSEFGLTMFCGRQGAGKTSGMVWYLETMRKRYPKAKIVTNIDYVHQDQPFLSWEDLINIRNGEDGVIFAIDELQNHYSSLDWKDFPEYLLSEITQQRKQRVKIIASSQVFTRVVKQLREQTFEVVECRTLLGRWTFLKAFYADDYNYYADHPDPDKKRKMRKVWRASFIQSDKFRTLFDTYAKVQRLAKAKPIPREQRFFS